ncbi:hypothetical protein [Bythopirellula goksoeyrii]|uniref:Putative lipoprotein n=1 Tax=Bythopirellula goksoeyrii TaxID=1400387 RepID=A0A5B9Q7D0_9BACT|nr:hypothetical protein [Bythopirellula goksoeyrii]QEG33640.1 putative lipoprotein [Bythopirellula goksoeyrii]
MTHQSLLSLCTSCLLVSSAVIPCISPNSATAQGVVRNWTGGGATDDWFDAANWSPGAVPDPADLLLVSSSDIAGLDSNIVNISDGGRIEISSLSATATLSRLDVGLQGEGTLDMSGGTLTTGFVLIGTTGNSFGTANITGNTSTWNITDGSDRDLYVGEDGEGRLNITGGADIDISDDVLIGNRASGIGVVNVSGSGSTLDLLDAGVISELIVGGFGRGTLNVTNSAAVTSRLGAIANSSGSNGKATVDSAGTWSITEEMYVGSGGTGTLEILGGGSVDNSTGYIARDSTGVGRVLVEGANSLWDVDSTLYVADEGYAELEVRNGGRVVSSIGIVGNDSTGNGSVIVEGDDSMWDIASTLRIGEEGTGSLTISDGAAVENTFADIGNLSGSTGVVTVEGAGSTWTNSSVLNIADSGDGTLNIAGGATVSNTAGNIGFASGSDGTVNVSGGSSHWSNESLVRVGVSGSGTLNILGGAKVSSTHAGIGVIGSGNVSIEGAGSRWIATSSGGSTVGEDGNATMQITSGGAFETPGNLVVAKNDASTSSLTVTGNGSRLDLGFSLSLGNVGGTSTGSATIGTGAHVTVGTSTVIQNANSSLTVDGGSLTTTSLINNNGGTFVFNSGTITIDGGGFHPGNSFLLNGNSTATLNLQGNGVSDFSQLTVGNTGDAVLRLAEGHSLTLDEGTIGVSGEFILDGGHLAAETFNNLAGGEFTFLSGRVTVNGDVLGSSAPFVIPTGGTVDGSGFVEADVVGQPGSTITVTSGNYTLGNPFSFLGFVHEGTLSVGNRIAKLKSAGFAQLGALTTLSGGTITADNGISLGGGDVIMGKGDVNAKIAAGIGSFIYAPGGDLTLGDANAFDGFVSAGNMTVDADSIILLDRNQAQLGTLTTVIGGGKVVAANGVVLDFASAITGDGNIDTPNDPLRPTIINGTVEGTSSNLSIGFNGYVKGIGMLNNVYFTGTHAPGLSPAELLVGNLTYANSATLEIEIGGLTAGNSFDKLTSNGILDLDGTLDVTFLNNFMPSLGDSFEIITAANVIDEFAFENLPDIGPLLWNVNYGATSVLLEVLSPFTADFDQDGDVDGNDFLVWQRNPGVGSLIDWQAQYGSVLPLTANANAVPEPQELFILTCIALFSCMQRVIR